MLINKRLWDRYFRWYDKVFFGLMGAKTTTEELPTPNADRELKRLRSKEGKREWLRNYNRLQDKGV